MGGENLNKSTSDAGEAWSKMAASVEAERNVAEKRAEVTEKAKKNSTLKKFVLGAIFALGIITMAGCGKDGDASAVSEPTPSVSIEYNTPTSSYEINDDDEGGNSAYNPGEITVIDGEQDGGDGNVDVEPGGDGGEVEADDSEFWDGNTFNLVDYAKSLGYVEYDDWRMAKGFPGVGYTLISSGGIVFYDTSANEIWSISCVTNSTQRDASINFVNGSRSASTVEIESFQAGLEFCSTVEGLQSVSNGDLPDGWK